MESGLGRDLGQSSALLVQSLYDEAGAVRGAHTEATDATERAIGARRLAVLNDLGGLAGRARSVVEACELITLALSRAEHDVPR
jgi:hypothetical protein